MYNFTVNRVADFNCKWTFLNCNFILKFFKYSSSDIQILLAKENEKLVSKKSWPV